MIRFNCVFGDAPSSGYGIYVVLHVAYGQTYVVDAYDDSFSFRGGFG